MIYFKKVSLLSALFLFSSQISLAQAVSVSNSQQVKLYSPAIKDTFSISITVPENYASSNKSYPVIYVTDPFFVYGSTVESARAHAYDGRMPETIIVGLGYTGPQKFRRIMQLRTRDYTPEDRFVLPSGVEPQWAKEMSLGNAEEFRAFFRETLFSYMEDNFRVADDRTYVGWSGGGWFGHYIMFHEPELFDRYLLGSSGYWFDRDRAHEGNLYEYEERYAADHESLDVDLFLSVGDMEPNFMVDDMMKMIDQLKSRNYEGLNLDWHIFEEQKHYSVWPVAINMGLLVLFEDEQEAATGGLSEIKE